MAIINKLDLVTFNTKRIVMLLISLNLFMLSLSVESKETKLVSGAVGYWQNADEDVLPKVNWQASWIWPKSKQASTMSLFRKKVVVKQAVNKALIHITASSVYKLYVNGRYVNRGPARSAPHHQSFDSIDISSFMKQGENIIAVQVHFQPEVNSYQHKARAGLLAQLEFTTKQGLERIVTGPSWRAIVDPRWDSNELRMSRFHQEVNDRVELSAQLNQWRRLSFDDNSWPKAQSLMRNSGWPSPQKNDRAMSLISPWTQLIPRTIDYLTEQTVKPNHLIADLALDDYLLSATGEPEKKLNRVPRVSLKEQVMISRDKQEITVDEPLIIQASQKGKARLLVFDFHELINGLPEFQIQGNKGDIVEVIAIPYMHDNSFSYESVDAHLIDRITLSGELDNWQAMYFKPTRYLGVVVKPNSGQESKPVVINHLGLLQISYPFISQGNISSIDAPWIAQYMQASADTIKAATTDAYTDNYRERRQYAQTGFYAVLGNYYTFGDHNLHARNLIQVAQEQFANGLMPAYAPLQTNDYMVILDSNLLWVRSLHRYLLYSGDKQVVNDLLPTASKLLALLESYTNEDGLIDSPPFAYWLDHAKNDRRGANLNLNGHYIGALEDFAEILQWLNLEGSEHYLAQAKKMRKAIQSKFWHQQQGLFVDALVFGKQSDQFSEHANAMALALNIATPEQAKKVADILLKEDELNYVSRDNGMTMVTPAMSYFLHKGLANYGYIDESFALFKRRFDKMLNENSQGTLWEEWWLNGTGRSGVFVDNGRTRSSAQTESAFAPALFAEYIIGVKPVTPGMATFKLFNRRHSITDVSADIPTPHGNVTIIWSTESNKKQLDLIIPDGVQIELDETTFSGHSIAGKVLSKGEHTLLLTNVED